MQIYYLGIKVEILELEHIEISSVARTSGRQAEAKTADNVYQLKDYRKRLDEEQYTSRRTRVVPRVAQHGLKPLEPPW